MTIIRTDMKKTLITKTDILPKILKQQTRLTMNQAKGKNRKFPNSMTSAKRKKRKLPDSIIQPNIGLFSDIWTRIPPRSDSRSGLSDSLRKIESNGVKMTKEEFYMKGLAQMVVLMCSMPGNWNPTITRP